MRQRSRILLLAATLASLFAAVVPTLASAKLTGCNNPADSALNQYCDTVPTSTGSQVPQTGTPALGSTLPPATVRPIAATPGARPLLRLPAASPPPVTSAHHGRTANHAVSGSASITAKESKVAAIPGWLIALLVVAVLAMLGAAAQKRSRSSD